MSNENEVHYTENNALGREFSFSLIMFHQQVAEKLGLNVTDYKVLSIIPNEGITAGEIADYAGLSTGMVTTVVDRLQKKGFVFRDKDPSDRRKVIIRKNMEVTYTEVFPIFQSFGLEMGKLFAGYDEHEINAIIDFLSKSVEVFKKETKKLKSTE